MNIIIFDPPANAPDWLTQAWISRIEFPALNRGCGIIRFCDLSSVDGKPVYVVTPDDIVRVLKNINPEVANAFMLWEGNLSIRPNGLAFLRSQCVLVQ